MMLLALMNSQSRFGGFQIKAAAKIDLDIKTVKRKVFLAFPDPTVQELIINGERINKTQIRLEKCNWF